MNHRLRHSASALLVLAAAIPLALYAYLGQFSRLMWDDFCNFGLGQQITFWEILNHNRTTTRHASSYLDNFFWGLTPPQDLAAVRLFLLLVILIWLPALAWLVRSLCRLAQVKGGSKSRMLAASALMLAGILFAMPSPQVLYWYAGAVRYLLPLAILTVYVALLLEMGLRPRSNKRDGLALAAGALLCFFSAGLAEMSLVIQIATLVIMTPLLLCARQPADRGFFVRMWLAGLMASLAGLAIVVSAPSMIGRVSSPFAANQGVDFQFILSSFLGRTNNYVLHEDFNAVALLSLAIGALLSLRGCQASSQSRAADRGQLSRAPLLALLAVQLALIPVIWDHASDLPAVLGRFSAGYALVIAINLLLTSAFCILLWRRRIINDHLRRRGWGATHLWALAVLVVAGLVLLAEARSIHWRALVYLTASQSSILLAMLWQSRALAAEPLCKRLLFATFAFAFLAYIVTAAVIFVELLLEHVIENRTMGFMSVFCAIAGLLMGMTMGCAIRAQRPAPAPLRVIQAGFAFVILALALNIAREQAALMPRFRQFAQEWDARHAQILADSQRGLQVIEVQPLSVDLEKEISRRAAYEEPCSNIYYGVKDIILAEA